MIPAALSVEESPSFSIEQWIPNRAQSKFLGLWLCKQHPVISLQGGWGVGKTQCRRALKLPKRVAQGTTQG